MNDAATLRRMARKLANPNRLAKLLFSVFRLVFICGICFTILYPLLTKLSMSFMDETDLYDRTVKTIAKHFTPQNYWETAQYIGYGELLVNTIGLCTAVGLLQAVSCTLVGYGFARFRFRFRGPIFLLVVLCMIMPTQVILTPLYLNFKSLGMLGSFAPFLSLAATAVAPRCGLYIFLARQYFRGIPKEIDEAASIDGAGAYKTFARVMLPGALPIMMTIFLFSFVWQWTENTYTPLFYSSFNTIAQALNNLDSTMAEMMQNTSAVVSMTSRVAYQSIIKATTTLLAIFPLLILYVICQRFFTESVERSGIVG